MNDSIRVKIVEVSNSQSRVGCFFAIITFAPMLIGFITLNPYWFWSVPIGCVLMFITSHLSNGKYNAHGKVQHNSFVEIGKTQLLVNKANIFTTFDWADLIDLKIKVREYDGEIKTGAGHTIDRCTGRLNYISFKRDNSNENFRFYLKNLDEKMRIISFIENELILSFKDRNIKCRCVLEK